MPRENKQLAVFCADVGSAATGHFGWHGSPIVGGEYGGSSMEELAEKVTEELTKGQKVALGFECPLFVPVRNSPQYLMKARAGEGNRPWSAGAGCGALATGIVQSIWLLRRIKDGLPATPGAYLSWPEFQAASGPALFIWEAFVSSTGKGTGHAHDAQLAVDAFKKSLPNPDQVDAIDEPKVFSLAGAALLATGWSKDAGILNESCLVIRSSV